MAQLKIYGIDTGFCRVNYVGKNTYGQKIYYCIQDEGTANGCVIYRMSGNPDNGGEPDYPVKGDKTIFEIPPGDSVIEKTVRAFLQNMKDLFYVQDKRSFAGNDILFWRNGGGYTTDVSKAEVFTKDKAMNLHKNRHTDVPWPKEYIDSHTKPAVDMQHVKNKEALKAVGIKLPPDPKPPRQPQRQCPGCGKFIRNWDYMCSGCED